MAMKGYWPQQILEGRVFPSWRIICLIILWLAASTSAAGQAPLHLINSETEISRVRFRGNETLSDAQLRSAIATVGPRWVERWTFWKNEVHVFDPVELQKDLIRMQRLYARNGFSSPRLDYIAQLEPADNSIRILFTIDEGPPLLAQSIDFYGPDGENAAYQFAVGEERTRWNELRRELTYLRTGDRLTDYGISRIQDRIIESLSNSGYAFTHVRSETVVDSVSHFADVHILVDSGPKALVDSIFVVGAESVAPRVIIQEMEIEPGDSFEHRLLSRSQRALFSLDLFRLALVGLAPDQRVDSTASITVRVEEAAHRYVRAQTGYAKDDGLSLEGAWTHRNFLGGARKLSVQATWLTGLAAFSVDDIATGNRQRVSVSLLQPHLGNRKLSGIVSPYFERRQDPATEAWEAGLITNLVYKLHPFRPLSLRHTFARAVPILGTAEKIGSDFYNKSLVELTAILGHVDNYVRPERGILVQPFLEYSGGLLQSDVEYAKFGGDLTAYQPAGDVDLSFRLFAGALHTWGASANPDDPVAAERLDPIQFYAGGSRDVRGWSNRGLGPKTVVASGDPVDGIQSYVYEPNGGTRKIAGSVDVGIPLFGLNDRLMGGLFLDFAQVVEQGEALSVKPSAFRFGSGVGLRMLTPAGMVRLDLAAKLNPSAQDMRSAADFAALGTEAPTRPGRRFRFHISLGRDL